MTKIMTKKEIAKIIARYKFCTYRKAVIENQKNTQKRRKEYGLVE